MTAGCVVHHPVLPPRAASVSNKTHQFPSGLRVVVEREPGSKRLAIAILVGGGSANDPPGKEGLAHFMEHLAFRSKPANRLSAWEELDYAGLASSGSSQANAYTRPESTTYVGIAPSASAAQVLPLMASLVVRPLVGVDDGTLEVERNVIRQERYDSDPHAGGAVLDGVSAATLPPGYPGSRPIGGTEASLGAITRADLELFQRTHYQPANTVVVLVGDLEQSDAEKMVVASFPREWLTADRPVPPRNAEGAVDARVPNPPSRDAPPVEARVKHRRLLFTWAVPGLAQPSGSAMSLVRDSMKRALPKPKGGRWLNVSLAEDVRTSLLIITVELEDDARPEDVREELRKTTDFGSFSVADWARSTNDGVLFAQRLVDRAEERALSMFATGRANPLDRGPTPGRLAALKTVEKDILIWARASEVLVVPFVRTTPAADRATPQVVTPRPRIALDSAALAAVALGPPVGRTKHFTLENGLEVLVSSRTSLPVVSVALGLPGRALHTPRDVGTFLDYMLRWDLDSDTWRVGAPEVEVTADATVVQLTGESKDVPLMLDAIGHALPPRVDWNRTDLLSEAVKKVEESVGKMDEEEKKLFAPGLVSQVMPPRSAAVPTGLDELKDLERRRFVDFVDLSWRPDGAWLVIEGDVDFVTVEGIVRDNFTSWRARKTPLPAPASPGAAPLRLEKAKVVENQDAAVTEVRFVCRVPSGASADVGGVALLEHALVAHFEGALRRDMGLAYAVRASSTRWRHEDNVLSLSVTLNPANKQAALRKLLAMLTELDGAVWDEQQVNVARWHVAKEHIGTGLTSSAVAFDLARWLASGVALDEALARPARLAKAPLPAVDDAWAACNDTFVLEVEGERSSLEAALKDAGLRR